MSAGDPLTTPARGSASAPHQSSEDSKALPVQNAGCRSPLLEVCHLSKHFGNVMALSDASLTAAFGEVTAIVGDNGAGKSTLVKCVSGVHQPDHGDIIFDGKIVRFASPQQSRAHGIETLYQDLALIEDMTIWQNMYLSRELTRKVCPVRVLKRSAMRKGAAAMLEQLHVQVQSVNARVRRLSGGQRQGVAICRAVGWGAKLIILDEPTAALGVQETANVEHLVARLRNEGLAILLVSHNFEQVMRLSDQVWVMRNGKVVGARRTAETSGQELVAILTGAVEA
jgi:ABC-type sugar transport system ATPase subunit